MGAGSSPCKWPGGLDGGWYMCVVHFGDNAHRLSSTYPLAPQPRLLLFRFSAPAFSPVFVSFEFTILAHSA